MTRLCLPAHSLDFILAAEQDQFQLFFGIWNRLSLTVRLLQSMT